MAESKLRVLLVHNFYQIRGGEDSVFENEKRLLEEHGHEVFTYTRHNNEIKTLSWWRKLFLPLTAIFSLRTYRDIKRLIREHRIDVVHVHNTLPLVSPAVYYAAQSAGAPVVQHVHNYRLQCPEGNFCRGGKICQDCVRKGFRCAVKHRCYRRSFLQTMVSAASLSLHRMTSIYRKLHYICMTPFTRDLLLQANQPADKIEFEPSRVHVRPHFTRPSSVSHREGRFYLFIGRMEKIKGVGLLLDAFRRMPERRLVLAGTGSEYEHFFASAADCTNITFKGFCSRAQLDELLAEAKAVIVPSQYYEPFGLIIVEAYAAGVPVLVGDIGGFSGLVEPRRTGILYPYHSEAGLREAVEKFEAITDTDWTANCQDLYRRRFSAEAAYLSLVEIYEASRREDASQRKGMNVLISLADQSFGATKSVGIFNVSMGLVRGLANSPEVERLDVLVNRDCAPYLKGLPPHVVLHGIERKTPSRFHRVWWDQVGIVRAIHRLNPDWVIMPKGVPPLCMAMGKARMACFVHDLNWEQYERCNVQTDSPFPCYQYFYFRFLHLRALRRADLVLTSTRFNRERFLHYVPQAKIEVVGIGFDESVRPCRAGRGDDVLFFASPYPHKLTPMGISRLRAWLGQRDDADRITIHVVGWLPDGTKLPDHGWVEHGRISQSELDDLLEKKCRVALYCSAYEGYGMPPVECLRAGIPCVASDIPSIREHVPQSLLFDNESEASFINVMNAAYAMTQLPEYAPFPSWNEVGQRVIRALIASSRHD